MVEYTVRIVTETRRRKYITLAGDAFPLGTVMVALEELEDSGPLSYGIALDDHLLAGALERVGLIQRATRGGYYAKSRAGIRALIDALYDEHYKGDHGVILD